MLSAGSNSSCNVIVAQSFLTTPAKFWIDSTGAGTRESVDIKPEPILLPDVNDKYGYWLFALAGGVTLGAAGLLIFKMILTASPD